MATAQVAFPEPGPASSLLTGAFTASCAGPVLLEDIQTIQRVSDLTKERIPVRRVHAQGAVAKGYFEVRISVSATFIRSSDLELRLL